MEISIIHKINYKLPAGMSTEYFRGSDWRLILVKEGEAQYRFPESKSIVKAGDIFLLAPSMRKISTLNDQSFEISVIFFNTEEKLAMENLCLFNRQNKSYRLLREMFLEIHGQTANSFHVQMLKIILEIFFRENKQGFSDERISKAIDIIYRQNGWRLKSVEIAREVGLSRVHFNKLFKLHTGNTYAEFCNKVRMETALTLMQEYGLSAKLTAHKIGCSSPQAFSREFKAYFNSSPNNYLK